MFNYLKDKTYFQRNAAIALGNTKNEKYIPDLKAELNNPSEMVRLHTVWALGQIPHTRSILEKHATIEQSSVVLNEIRETLAH